MNIIAPIPITDAMIAGGTSVPELTGTEAAWATATAYTVGTVVTLAATKRRYYCKTAHTSGGAGATPNTLPDTWHDVGPVIPLWVNAAAYVVGDYVHREGNARFYVCKLALGSSTSPPETDTNAWTDLGPIDLPWKTGVAYVVGDTRIRHTTHRKYKCAVAHTSAGTLPEADPTRWVDVGPSSRFAPFDWYTSTPAVSLGTQTWVLLPGYFNAVALYGAVGSQYTITLKDAPGGTTLYTATGYLYEDPAGWYEYLFGPVRPLSKLVKTGLPIRPNAELTVTLTAAATETVQLGMLVVGDYVPLIGAGQWGGTLHGSTAEPVTYSYINTAEDGTTTVVRRHAGTNIRARVALPRSELDYALQTMQRVLDQPVAWVATSKPGYQGLTAFGLGSAVGTYDSHNTASIEILVKGLI